VLVFARLLDEPGKRRQLRVDPTIEYRTSGFVDDCRVRVSEELSDKLRSLPGRRRLASSTPIRTALLWSWTPVPKLSRPS
jgi:hypothetical protein